MAAALPALAARRGGVTRMTLPVLLLALTVGPPCAADETDLAGKELSVAEDIACSMCGRIVVRHCRRCS
jgi:hypothetical protein